MPARLKIAKLFGSVVLLYLIFPFIAGVFAIGDRDGPKIYPLSYHHLLYMISYESVWHEKPRQNVELDRPWFYGFPRSLRAQRHQH
jgi:hypothetical protein